MRSGWSIPKHLASNQLHNMIFKAFSLTATPDFPTFSILAATKTPFMATGRFKMTLNIWILLRRLLRTIPPSRSPLSAPHHSNHMWKSNPCISPPFPHIMLGCFHLKKYVLPNRPSHPRIRTHGCSAGFRLTLKLFTDCHENDGCRKTDSLYRSKLWGK